MAANGALLELDRVTMRFGGLKAVAALSLAIARGELFGLIGPNGAGKTTVFNVITGAYAPTEGHVRFEGQPIEGLKPHAVAHRGITRTFQNIRLFGSRCCRDNVCIAAHQHAEAGLADAIFRTGRFARDEARLQREANELLAVMGLGSGPTPRPRTCPTASSAGSRSRARSPAGRGCCCWTSRPRA